MQPRIFADVRGCFVKVFHKEARLIFGSAMQINIQDDFEPDFYQFIVAVPNWLNLHPEADRASDLP